MVSSSGRPCVYPVIQQFINVVGDEFMNCLINGLIDLLSIVIRWPRNENEVLEMIEMILITIRVRQPSMCLRLILQVYL